MKLFTRSRLVALTAVVIAGVSVGVALAGGPIGGGTASRAHDRDEGCTVGRGQLERNKRNVVAYYTTAFNEQEPEKAVQLFGGPVYIQHNPQAADGFQAFIDFVNSFTAQFPQLNVDIKRVIAECNLVVTHSHLTLTPGSLGFAVADIFRLTKDGKIVEHWDVIQEVPATSANNNTMF